MSEFIIENNWFLIIIMMVSNFTMYCFGWATGKILERNEWNALIENGTIPRPDKSN